MTTKPLTLQDLAVKHPYYCSETSYHGDRGIHATMTDFLDEFENTDIDYNLVVRWDVYEPDKEHPEYRALISILHQRKGYFVPHLVRRFEESEVDRFVSYLQKHHETIKKLRAPFA
jgi:hypothetical protein